MAEIVEQTITERLVGTLTLAWRAIRAAHPDVPDVVLTLGSGTLGRRGGETMLGHFAENRWTTADGRRHELFVGGEGLALGAVCLMETLLHEAAHGVAAVRDIKDTSRQGRYHNRRYKALAEELGLRVTEDRSIGWSPTKLTPEAAEQYADVISDLQTAIRAYRVSEHATGQGTVGETADGAEAGDHDQADEEAPKKDTNLAVAQCACPRKIRVARSTLELAAITCQACGEQFGIDKGE